MKKEDKIKVLENLILQLEQKQLQGEVDLRVWTAECLTKSNDQNLANQTQAKALAEMVKKQIAKAKELLDEVKK